MAFNFSPGGVYNPRSLDFSALANVPDDFWKGQEQGRQAGLRDALGQGLPTLPDGSIDWAKAASIVGQFDPQLGMRTAAYAQKNTLTPEQAVGVKIAENRDDRAERELALKYPGGKPRQSATDKKARYDAEDALPDIESTIQLLDRAEQLNSKTYEGIGASTRGTLGAKLPDWLVPDSVASKEQGDATNEWELLMAPAALKDMSATLKGQTSNMELQRYIGFLADPSTPRAARANIIARLKELSQKAKAIKTHRVEELGGGGEVSQDAPDQGNESPYPETGPRPSDNDMQELTKHQADPAFREEFERIYGPGSVDRWLNNDGWTGR
jgi:hypothetical protein